MKYILLSVLLPLISYYCQACFPKLWISVGSKTKFLLLPDSHSMPLIVMGERDCIICQHVYNTGKIKQEL